MATTPKTGTYTPSTSTVATQGTSSAANSALQTSLNAKGANLVVDGKYGPATAAAVSQYGGTTTPTKTIAETYNMGTGVDPAITKASNAVDTYYQNLASGKSNVDENAIRNQTLSQFQAEIDATNSLYADRLKAAQEVGAGRLGSDTAIQARRGLLGSDFGAARTDTTVNQNTTNYNTIENEKATAISNILANARKEADARIAAKNSAIASGLPGHLEFLKSAQASKEANATKAAQSIYDQNFKPEDLTTDTLKSTAELWGIKPEDIKSAYVTVKNTGDAAKAQKAAEDAKNKAAGMKVIPTGSTLVDSNGNVIARGTPKASVATKTNITPFKSGVAVFSPQQMTDFSTTLEASKGADNYVNPDIYQQAYEAWVDPKVGGLAKDFLLKYPPSKYVNPTNKTLPSYLRSYNQSPTTKTTGNEIDPATGLPAWLSE